MAIIIFKGDFSNFGGFIFIINTSFVCKNEGGGVKNTVYLQLHFLILLVGDRLLLFTTTRRTSSGRL